MAEAVGTVRVNFTGGTGGLDASANTAAANIEAMGGTATAASGQFVHFNTHLLESRKTISTVAAVAGTSTGPLMHFVHAFGLLGPIVGAAAIGIMLWRDSVTDAMQRADEEAKKFKELMKSTDDMIREGAFAAQERQGYTHTFIAAERAADRYMEKINEVEAQLKTLHENESLTEHFITGNAEARNLEDQLDKLYALKNEQEAIAAKHRNEREKHEGEHGGMASHMMKAVSGGQLGVLRLEHVGHDPNTALLQQIAKNTQKTANQPDTGPAYAG